MPEFSYTAFNESGQPISGEIEAKDLDAATRVLSERGYYVVDVAAAGVRATAGQSPGSLFSRNPSAGEITLFTRELELLLTSGQNLAEALALIEEDSSSRRVQGLASRIRQSVAAGGSLEEALRMESGSFPPVYVGMVKAAESSGRLVNALSQIAEMREREETLWAKVNSAILYPSLLIATAIAAVLVLMLVVVPRFNELLGDQVKQLPAASRVVLEASNWLTGNAEALGYSAVGLFVVLLVVMRQPLTRRFMERVMLRLPLIGNLIKMALSARFCRTLGGLTAAEVGLPSALALTRDTFANESAREIIDRMGQAVREGRDFTELMGHTNLFPLMLVSMLKIGADSGELSQTALRLADMYETKLQIAMHRLVSVLEPTIILVLSIFCGFIVLSIVSAVLGVYDLAGV